MKTHFLLFMLAVLGYASAASVGSSARRHDYMVKPRVAKLAVPVPLPLPPVVPAAGACGKWHAWCKRDLGNVQEGDWSSYCTARVSCAACRGICGVGFRFRYSEFCRKKARNFSRGKCCKGSKPSGKC